MPGKKWTNEEKKILVELYPNVETEEITKRLSCSVMSIACQASRLELKKSEKCKAQVFKLWSEKEKNALRKLWKTHNMYEIAKILNRTPKSINSKATDLKLIKYRRWDDERVKTFRNLWETKKSTADIASEMEISKALVSRMACKLHLSRRYLYSLHLKGFNGEQRAQELIKRKGWKIIERGISRGKVHAPAFDFIVETNKGKKYAINVKHGKNMAVSMLNIERLLNYRYQLLSFL